MDKLKILREMIHRLVAVIDKKQQRKSISVLWWIIVASFLEMLGISAVVPFVQVILQPEGIAENVYVKQIMGFLSIENTSQLLAFASIGLILVYVVKNVMLVWAAYCRSSYRNQLQKDLSIKVLRVYLKRPYEFFVNTNSADVLRDVTSDTSGFAVVVENIFKIIAEMLTLIIIVVYIVVTDPVMAFGLFATAMLLVAIVLFGLRNITGRAGQEQREAYGESYRQVQQAVSGIKEITVMQRRTEFAGKFEKAAEKLRVATLKYSLIMSFPERIIEAGFISGVILMVLIRMGQGVDAASYVPQLGAFAVAAFRILPSITKLTNDMNGIIFYKPTVDAVYANIQQAREKYGTENILAIESDETEPLQFERQIEIRNVCWRYANTHKDVLHQASLTVHKGESVALIGESGAGKTTLADIILGLLKPQSGEVLVDDADIFSHAKGWSRLIGYVPQSVYLMDDTIRNNILFECSDADDDKIWSALEQAQLKEFVEHLPNGLDTIVGEQGVKFSGGQRQRIAIARALYYNPEILVLDEATAALDNETEKAVMESIEVLQGTKTLIIVAHRLSTIKKCDSIYEIKGGKAILKNKNEVI